MTLAIFIVVALCAFLSLRIAAIRRVRQGRPAIVGTRWMVPPSYYQSQQQYGNVQNAAPPYTPNPGAFDAGFYDVDNHFIPKGADIEAFPQAHVRTPQASYLEYYPPPPGPPPVFGPQNYDEPPAPIEPNEINATDDTKMPAVAVHKIG